MRALAPTLLALCLAAPAWAGDLAVTVATPAGKPVGNAVIMVRPRGFSPRGPIRFPWPYVMAQQDMQFDPFVLVVPVGAEVSFPNHDPFRHHVFSFSPAKSFELKLYSRDETRKVKLEKAGVVALGCNIHDDMTAFIRVVDTPYAAKTGAGGTVVLRDLPPGPATVTVWHPYLKRPNGEIAQSVLIPRDGQVQLKLAGDLRAPPLRRGY
ncbi:MAG: methylamine utilization protein [Phenylobacterium sp.]|nr:methylamine utilization protein [Phenylobacterium sp.]